METQDNTTPTPRMDPMEELRRQIVEAQKLLAIMDERQRLERGEDGFDG
jgi:hypothetical protein